METRLRRTALFACLGAAAVVLTACDEFNPGVFDRYHEDFHYSYPLSSGGTVELENSNGSVEIIGWDKNTVDIEGSKYASSEAHIQAIHIEITPSANAVSIRTVTPRDWRGNAGARYVIRVPRRVELQNIASSNGSIKVEAIQGGTHLRTSNGSIRATGVQGSLDAHTSNGTIEIIDVSGDTTLRTSNGSIKADVKKGAFEASTSNGSITARLVESDTHPVRLESTNGHIELTMDAAREVHAGTSNSSITVHMPSSVGASVRAHTSNSTITCDFDVSVHSGMMNKTHLEGTIGSGGPLLDLGTSNGSIKILRL